MRYRSAMDSRTANTAAASDASAGDWEEVPLDAADIAACEAAEAAVARGEWVDGEVVLAELRTMAARHRARARQAQGKATA
jgi:hypothetical protein